MKYKLLPSQLNPEHVFYVVALDGPERVADIPVAAQARTPLVIHDPLTDTWWTQVPGIGKRRGPFDTQPEAVAAIDVVAPKAPRRERATGPARRVTKKK